MALNRLNVKTKKQVLLANAIIRSPKFRASRMKTKEGRRLLNQETSLLSRKVKQFNIKLSKQLPKKVKV
ncbi:hypothetical protein LCGC14_0374510 [marine sediment metagenome]|uniref:Uncharacterized protein n=1 Tax=marine sediment metagenome TaxID=412755 RepID=A0A0F9VRF7_9ZZZZ